MSLVPISEMEEEPPVPLKADHGPDEKRSYPIRRSAASIYNMKGKDTWKETVDLLRSVFGLPQLAGGFIFLGEIVHFMNTRYGRDHGAIGLLRASAPLRDYGGFHISSAFKFEDGSGKAVFRDSASANEFIYLKDIEKVPLEELKKYRITTLILTNGILNGSFHEPFGLDSTPLPVSVEGKR